jgi:hypothetical protein
MLIEHPPQKSPLASDSNLAPSHCCVSLVVQAWVLRVDLVWVLMKMMMMVMMVSLKMMIVNLGKGLMVHCEIRLETVIVAPLMWMTE